MGHGGLLSGISEGFHFLMGVHTEGSSPIGSLVSSGGRAETIYRVLAAVMALLWVPRALFPWIPTTDLLQVGHAASAVQGRRLRSPGATREAAV